MRCSGRFVPSFTVPPVDLSVVKDDPHALVALAFGFELGDFEPPDLSRRAHVGTAVGLLVEADDVDDADLGGALGDQIDLRANEVVVAECDRPAETRYLDVVVRPDRAVCELPG